MKKLSYFTSKELKPKGFIKQQLEIQANGLSGNLDKVWKDIYDSKWIGGNSEGWERVPYWLDGFIPLAYLIENQDMIERAKTFINAIIDAQREDGWICPCSYQERDGYDLWAGFLILKVLVVYYECSNDCRIISVVEKAIKCFDKHIEKNKLFDWAKFRWFECIIPLYWLYNITHDEWLKEFAKKLKKQGFDYYSFSKTEDCQKAHDNWRFDTHVVNMQMALKCDALYESLIKNDTSGKKSKELYENIMAHHGTCVGSFTGDECLSGISPIQGSELCSIAEGMYSMRELYEITEDPYYLNVLEKLTYNAYPATNSVDMWTHQYDQQVNQVICTDFGEYKPFKTNNGESNMFGLEPNFGCCTANMSQAFPKTFLSAFARKDDKIISSIFFPCSLNFAYNNTMVGIDVDTLYPFRDTVTYSFKLDKPTTINFGIRIPITAKSATINGKNIPTNQTYFINKKFVNGEKIELGLEFEIKLEQSPSGLYHIERGSLIFSLPILTEYKMIEYSRDGVERKYPYCDYMLFPKSEWRYGFTGNKFSLVECDDFDSVFSVDKPPLKIKVNLSRVSWHKKRYCKGMCKAYPQNNIALSKNKELFLQPYGCTKLRMTDMPKIEFGAWDLKLESK